MSTTKAVEDLIKSFRRLTGVGPKTAQRFTFQLLAQDRGAASAIANALQFAIENVTHCKHCNNFSESSVCSICQVPDRDKTLLCIVETPADLNSFEATGVYNGYYYVLMGRISPMEGIGPDDLNVSELLINLSGRPVEEIIIATNSTIEGDATADFLSNLLTKNNYSITRLARGLPLDGELEYMDKGTLIEAFQRRVPAAHY